MENNNSHRINPMVIVFVVLSTLFVLLLIGNTLTNDSPKKIIKHSDSQKAKNRFNNTANKAVNDNHFLINADKQAGQIEKMGEEYYSAMPSLTGLPSGDSLGLSSIKINIFQNTDDYVKETGKPGWSEGFADFKNKEISIKQSDGLLVSVLPHEISHLFFDTYMGYENKDVNWLDEGLATSAQVQYDKEQSTSFKNAMIDIRSDKSIAFNDLVNFELNDKTPIDQVNIYYAQTLSIVHYLKTQDLEQWQSLLKKLKSGKSFNESLFESYKITSDNLQSDWLTFVKTNKQTWET